VTAATIPGWRSVTVDAGRRTVKLPAGASLDLGATAKALAADRCAARASERAGCGVLVSLSGDIATAGAGPEGGWLVRVADDHRAPVDAPGQTIHLPAGGLASSSTTVRRWAGPDGRVHHLIDPATGAPSQGPWRTVTVAAHSCLAANVASAATIIGGEPRLPWLIESGLPARLVAYDGTVRHVCGWPEEGDDLPFGAPAAA
jgi:FAD:protein FMN transferase